jgi:excisionase family DNA binding protein
MSRTRNIAPSAPRVRSLSSHPDPFIRAEDLARYWSVSRRQIYKNIEEGKLAAVRLGPRSLRIPTSEAVAFEQRSLLATPEGRRALLNGRGGRPARGRLRP